MKVVRNRFQLMKRYNGHGEDVRGCGKVGRCDSHKLLQSSMRCEQ